MYGVFDIWGTEFGLCTSYWMCSHLMVHRLAKDVRFSLSPDEKQRGDTCVTCVNTHQIISIKVSDPRSDCFPCIKFADGGIWSILDLPALLKTDSFEKMIS